MVKITFVGPNLFMTPENKNGDTDLMIVQREGQQNCQYLHPPRSFPYRSNMGEWNGDCQLTSAISAIEAISKFPSHILGRFQQEAHMSDFQDQRKANRAISVHEGLAIGIIAIKCRGRYTCSKLGRKKWADILLSP